MSSSSRPTARAAGSPGRCSTRSSSDTWASARQRAISASRSASCGHARAPTVTTTRTRSKPATRLSNSTATCRARTWWCPWTQASARPRRPSCPGPAPRRPSDALPRTRCCSSWAARCPTWGGSSTHRGCARRFSSFTGTRLSSCSAASSRSATCAPRASASRPRVGAGAGASRSRSSRSACP